MERPVCPAFLFWWHPTTQQSQYRSVGSSDLMFINRQHAEILKAIPKFAYKLTIS